MDGGSRVSLKRAAEEEMCRRLPDGDDFDGSRPEIGRFRYDAVNLMRDGTKGYLCTCKIRRERSCSREATTVLLKSETQLPSAKLSARGVVFLLAPEGDSDQDILSNVDQVYASPDLRVDFVVRMTPILHTVLCDDSVPAALERIGLEVARVAFCSSVFPIKDDEKMVSFALQWNGRKLCNREQKQQCIDSLGKGFAAGCPGGVRVDLVHPDVVVIVEAIEVMSKRFFLVGLAPSSWLETCGKLQLKSLLTPSQSKRHKGSEVN
jgi:hypothetical protein